MTFPEKLSRLCWQKRWSQRELAEALGDVSKSTVSNWMTGKTDPRLSELARLARLFRVSVDYLVLDERKEPGGDGLSEEQRRVLWAAETVGYELALKRIMNAPASDPDPASGRSDPSHEVRASSAAKPSTGEAPRRTRPGGRGPRHRASSGGSKE